MINTVFTVASCSLVNEFYERINFIKPIFWKTLGQIGALTVQISIIEGHKYITILSSNTHTKNPHPDDGYYVAI